MPPVADYSQATNLAAQQKQDFSSLLNQQQATSQGLFNQYSAASQAQPKLVDVLNNAENQAGLGGLQQGINLFNTQSTGVKGLIDNLNTDTQARTAGTGANQAYLDRLRAVEGGNLNTQLSRLTSGLGDVTNAYNTANANTGQLLTATQADQATALHPLELQINSMSDQFARQITGFTTSAQNELTTLLDKLNAQQSLNDREWQQAATLAQQEQQFQQTRSLAAQDSASRASAFSDAGLTGKTSGVGTASSNGKGGFNFTNAAGQNVSAATFAAQNQIPVGSLLLRMGQSGDTNAALAYNNLSKTNNQTAFNNASKNFSNLFWGS